MPADLTIDPDVQSAIWAYADRGFSDGEELLPLDWLCDGAEAEGMCSTVSRDFAEVCRERGLDAYDSGYRIYEIGGEQVRPGYEHQRNPLLGTQHGPDDFGYTDRVRHSGYEQHSATIIELPGGEILCVDWTASQFGLTDFPLVQRKVPGGWQRLTSQPAPEPAAA